VRDRLLLGLSPASEQARLERRDEDG
jgi:hypothetical protein